MKSACIVNKKGNSVNVITIKQIGMRRKDFIEPIAFISSCASGDEFGFHSTFGSKSLAFAGPEDKVAKDENTGARKRAHFRVRLISEACICKTYDRRSKMMQFRMRAD